MAALAGLPLPAGSLAVTRPAAAETVAPPAPMARPPAKAKTAAKAKAHGQKAAHGKKAAKARPNPAKKLAARPALLPHPSRPVPWAALSPAAATLYREAVDQVDAGHYPEARRLAERGGLGFGVTLIDWLWLTRPDGKSPFPQLAAFMTGHPEWPSQPLLHRRAEEALGADPDDAQAKAWLTRHPPQTGLGKLRLADALLAEGDHAKGTALLRKAWIEGDFTRDQESALLKSHRGLLRAADQNARLERLLWNRQHDSARRQLQRVEAGERALGLARLGLQTFDGGVERLIERVPASLRQNPGLAYDRERWRRIKGLDDLALEILHSPAARHGDMEKWWVERHIQIRRALADGRVNEAQTLAASNGLRDAAGDEVPKALSEAEWLAGWIAFRFQKEPRTGLSHFERVYTAGQSPITRARGAYWSGRAAEALGDAHGAREWYGRAARHPTTFYGQLATLKIKGTVPLALPPDPEPTAAQAHAFDAKELVKVARLLAAIGQADRLRPFILRLNQQAKAPAEHQLVAQLADDLGRLDLGVTAAKRSARRGVTIVYRAFPLPDLRHPPAEPELPLIFAISRQESEFNPAVVSPAGARGLMQLMPATAKMVAADLRIPFKTDRLTSDPQYNLQLGSHYLDGLLTSFDGNYLLAIAAYNAGSSRVRQWIRDWGDPRSPGVDAIDWVELIPYAETRNYVQRVLEGLQVYRARLDSGGAVAQRIKLDLTGSHVKESCNC